MSHCVRHMEEPAANACGDCAREFCTRCLVYSFGPKKPPMCINCALYAGGVRNGHRPAVPAAARQATSGAPPRDKRAERAYRRAEKDAVKAAQKAVKKAVKKAARQGVALRPAASRRERVAQGEGSPHRVVRRGGDDRQVAHLS